MCPDRYRDCVKKSQDDFIYMQTYYEVLLNTNFSIIKNQ